MGSNGTVRLPSRETIHCRHTFLYRFDTVRRKEKIFIQENHLVIILVCLLPYQAYIVAENFALRQEKPETSQA